MCNFLPRKLVYIGSITPKYLVVMYMTYNLFVPQIYGGREPLLDPSVLRNMESNQMAVWSCGC